MIPKTSKYPLLIISTEIPEVIQPWYLKIKMKVFDPLINLLVEIKQVLSDYSELLSAKR